MLLRERSFGDGSVIYIIIIYDNNKFIIICMLYMDIYIYIYIYIFREGEIKFADRLSKERFFAKE